MSDHFTEELGMLTVRRHPDVAGRPGEPCASRLLGNLQPRPVLFLERIKLEGETFVGHA